MLFGKQEKLNFDILDVDRRVQHGALFLMPPGDVFVGMGVTKYFQQKKKVFY